MEKEIKIDGWIARDEGKNGKVFLFNEKPFFSDKAKEYYPTNGSCIGLRKKKILSPRRM
jgi:hypothetical protein